MLNYRQSCFRNGKSAEQYNWIGVGSLQKVTPKTHFHVCAEWNNLAHNLKVIQESEQELMVMLQ